MKTFSNMAEQAISGISVCTRYRGSTRVKDGFDTWYMSSTTFLGAMCVLEKLAPVPDAENDGSGEAGAYQRLCDEIRGSAVASLNGFNRGSVFDRRAILRCWIGEEGDEVAARLFAKTIEFSRAALECIQETGTDVGVMLGLLAQGQTREEILAYCLEGAEDDRVQGWRDYVDALFAAWES